MSALGHLGEIEEGRRIAAERQQIQPTYRSTNTSLARLSQSPVDAKRIKEGLNKVGLKV